LVVLTENLAEVGAGLNAPERLLTNRATLRLDSEPPPGENAKDASSLSVDEVRSVDTLREWQHLHCCIVPVFSPANATSTRRVVTVGRARDQNLVLRHPTVSKEHATLELEGDTWMVRDLGGRNRTYVNEQRIEVPAQVVPGDKLRFASISTLLITGRALWGAVRESADS
jgi:hypothetical protein